MNVDRTQIENAFSFAWIAFRERLESIEPHPDYRRTELGRVIKGRGITTFDGYLAIVRRGRILPLNANQKELVWGLYEHYQRRLSDNGAHDHNDLIELGRAELLRRPLETPYAAVVVDEVQDIPLTGLRLLRELAGDGPNKLLLVATDSNRSIPAAGGCPTPGSPSRVVARSSRSTTATAPRCWASHSASTRRTGWTTSTARTGSPVRRDHSALIVFQHKDLVRCNEILRAAGIPTLALENYTGEADGKPRKRDRTAGRRGTPRAPRQAASGRGDPCPRLPLVGCARRQGTHRIIFLS